MNEVKDIVENFGEQVLRIIVSMEVRIVVRVVVKLMMRVVVKVVMREDLGNPRLPFATEKSYLRDNKHHFLTISEKDSIKMIR